MIEYVDESLGVVKVLNVTEARANFAAVLSDNSAQYVITKNNKPLRIIVSYADYLKLKEAIEAKGSWPVDRTIVPADIAKNAHITVEEIKKKALKGRAEGRLKGLIETSLNDIKPQASKTPVVPMNTAQADSLTTSQHIEKINQMPAQTELATEADYFAAMAPGEEGVSDADSDSQKAVPQTAGIQQIMRQFVTEPDFSPTQKGGQKTTEPLPVKSAAKEDVSPQQSEYYKKYKKLYEAFETREPKAQETTPEIASAEEQTPVQAKDEKIAKANYWDENTGLEGEPIESKNTGAGENGEGGLPSLKDLLRDLEEESLSDDVAEKKNLGPKEIDDLINRITNDY